MRVKAFRCTLKPFPGPNLEEWAVRRRRNWSTLPNRSPLTPLTVPLSLLYFASLSFPVASQPHFPPLPSTNQSCPALTGPWRLSAGKGESHPWPGERGRKVKRRGGGSEVWGEWSVSNLNTTFSRLKLAASFPRLPRIGKETGGQRGIDAGL